MRVYFVNRFFWPAEPATAQLLADLTAGLAAAGWSVAVVTGHHAPGLAERETHGAVEIFRVGPVMAATQNLVRRGVDFAAFHLAARRTLRRLLQPGDVVVAMSDPPLLAVTVKLAAAARRARLVHWIHDIYPEVFHAVAANPGSALATALLRPARNAAWRAAAACVVLGEDMAGVVRDAGANPARVHVIPNWAPQGIAPAAPDAVRARREQWAPGARFVIGYSGNLGRVHDLDGLLEVAESLRSDPGFLFLFIGGGAGFARFQREAARRQLPNIRFLPPQPRAELAAALGVPDLHLVSVREGCERFVFPSKLYGVAAAGRPMLLLGPPDSEVGRLVTARGMGAAFRPGETAAIVAFLRDLAARPERLREFGGAAAQFQRDSGGWTRAVAAWDNLLRKLDAPA